MASCASSSRLGRDGEDRLADEHRLVGEDRLAGRAGLRGTSSAVSTPSTPGIASASLASMLVTRACGIGLSIRRQNTMPSARKSSAYLALPVTLPWMSGGTKFLPNNMCSSAMVEPSVALREELRVAARRDHAALRDSFDRLRPGARPGTWLGLYSAGENATRPGHSAAGIERDGRTHT